MRDNLAQRAPDLGDGRQDAIAIPDHMLRGRRGGRVLAPLSIRFENRAFFASRCFDCSGGRLLQAPSIGIALGGTLCLYPPPNP